MAQLGTICYIDNGKQFLLLERNKKGNDIHENKWVSVGGKFEAGESPEQCARREIFEETGLTAKKIDLKGVITFPEFTPDLDWYCFVYRVTEFEGNLIEECDEGTLHWVDYADIMKKPTWEGDYIYLDWLLNDAPLFSASFTYVENELKDYDVTFYQK